jgi:Fic family protein
MTQSKSYYAGRAQAQAQGDRYLSNADASIRYRKSISTLDRWRKHPTLGFPQPIQIVEGGDLLYSCAELDAFDQRRAELARAHHAASSHAPAATCAGDNVIAATVPVGRDVPTPHKPRRRPRAVAKDQADVEPALQQIAAKKDELDRLRRRTPDGLSGLEHTQDIELTYTSNAIEGNTLTAVETTLVIENGITIGGKPLKDHLEAIDHYEAMGYVRGLARQAHPLTGSDVRNLHRLVMQRSDPQEAGQYARTVRYVLTDTPPGRHYFPTPAEIPPRVEDLVNWLRTAPITAQTAFDAHRELVNIHPFKDGNGRTARLLMNLILLRSGYPPIAVRPQDRAAYLDALQLQGSGDAAAFNRLLYERLDAALEEHLSALRQALRGDRVKPRPEGEL